MTKIIYHYHPKTKEFLEQTEAAKSPLEKDVYLIPAFATEQHPLFEPGKISYFENGQWINKEIVQPATEKEKTEKELLEDLKNSKIVEIKQICDQKNIESITCHAAPIVDSEGELGEEVHFVFKTDRHPTNPAADPGSILLSAALIGSTNYFTKNSDGEKICVQINEQIARSLLAHLKKRNENNFKLAEKIIEAVNKAVKTEEVEAISWDVKYLNND